MDVEASCIVLTPSPVTCPPDLQMGQGLWRVARNQQLQQDFGDPCYLPGEHGGRRTGPVSGENLNTRRGTPHCQVPGSDISHLLRVRKGKEEQGFIDLEMLPPELSITILSYLNATDLCLASCVWQDLGNDEYLWQGSVRSPSGSHPLKRLGLLFVPAVHRATKHTHQFVLNDTVCIDCV